MASSPSSPSPSPSESPISHDQVYNLLTEGILLQGSLVILLELLQLKSLRTKTFLADFFRNAIFELLLIIGVFWIRNLMAVLENSLQYHDIEDLWVFFVIVGLLLAVYPVTISRIKCLFLSSFYYILF